MLTRLFVFLVGFGFSVAGGISTVAYLNFLTAGHTFVEYLLFVSQRIECAMLPVGLLLIWGSIYYPTAEE
jgi:hypothetical protein